MCILAGFLQPGENVQSFFSAVFETQRDGVVEFYEFMDFMVLFDELELAGEVTREKFITTMQKIRVGQRAAPVHPWQWDKDGVCSDEALRREWHETFKVLDLNKDGTLDVRELLGRKYTGDTSLRTGDNSL
jgi:Ca2+-binding EF-hand superfamily protein